MHDSLQEVHKPTALSSTVGQGIINIPWHLHLIVCTYRYLTVCIIKSLKPPSTRTYKYAGSSTNKQYRDPNEDYFSVAPKTRPIRGYDGCLLLFERIGAVLNVCSVNIHRCFLVLQNLRVGGWHDRKFGQVNETDNANLFLHTPGQT